MSGVTPEWKKVESPITRDGRLAAQRLVEAGHHADAGAHAEAAVEGEQRRQRAERVAADVAHGRELALAQRGVDGAVRAARAEHRRAHGQAGAGCGGVGEAAAPAA